MANTINELLILEKEQLGDRSGVISETSAYQFEDGTRLYNYRGDYSTWNCSIKLPNGSEERIHLKSLSEKHTGVLGPYGNELYMCLAHPPPYKIMKGVWTSPTTITFSPFRRMHYEENIHNGIGISYWHEGKGYAYRACDDPSQNAILIDCPLEKLRGLELLGIHRGKLFYTSEDTSAFPTLEKLGANVFHVKKQYMSPQHNSLCLDSSNYVYSPHEKHNFLTIDTRTMTILPLLQLKKGISIHEIIGVVEGRISMICYQDQKRYLITAQLPDGYFDQKNGVVPRMPSIVDQMNATIAELKQRDEHRTEEMERIQQRNNELEAANAQLINEKGARNVEEKENENVAADTEECEKLKGELEKLTRKYHKLLMMSVREEKSEN